MKNIHVENIGETVVTWTLPSDITEAESWDLATKGVRVMEYLTINQQLLRIYLKQLLYLFLNLQNMFLNMLQSVILSF